MEETLCPSCGFSPIPRDADACPKCGEPFSFLQHHKRGVKQFLDPIHDVAPPESTTFGGAITGAVTAHPVPPAVAFLTGAAIWFARVSGILVDQGEPSWLFGVVFVDVLVALVIFLAVGPATVISQLAALGQLGLSAWFARNDLANPAHILFMAHAVLLLVMVVAEPGPFRRALGLSMASALAVATIAVMGVLGMRLSATELGGARHGFRFRLPPGYVALTRDEVRPALRMPAGDAAPFGKPEDHIFGMIVSSRDPQTPLIGGCQGLHDALGATDEAKPMVAAAPPGMGGDVLVYGLTTGGGGVGRLACAKRADGRLVGFAVVVLAPSSAAGPALAEKAFERLGAELNLQ
jgi:hypothetical protein